MEAPPRPVSQPIATQSTNSSLAECNLAANWTSESKKDAYDALLSTDPSNYDNYVDMSDWNDYEFSPEKKEDWNVMAIEKLEAQTINNQPKSGIAFITRPKPNEPKLKADSGEGNAFLPLTNKWGAFSCSYCN